MNVQSIGQWFPYPPSMEQTLIDRNIIMIPPENIYSPLIEKVESCRFLCPSSLGPFVDGVTTADSGKVGPEWIRVYVLSETMNSFELTLVHAYASVDNHVFRYSSYFHTLCINNIN
ncbi:hypothetical protein ALC57_17403 [Trachymyrmex cornetzi]|uniref:Uncharacterized protein n=1 Tax=Trachymyrmex cornetzi TaxID=471704 RepID=A0A151ITY7_9HYME|nr:hypothetical protein ALC57_17403 [Trachymyrmex cornetzi]